MVKPLLALSLLIAIPFTSDKLKSPTAEELHAMRATVRDLQDLVYEHEERLGVHKAENDALRKKVTDLEARLAAVEKTRR